MAGGLAVLELPPSDLHRALLVADGAELAAAGAGLGLPEAPGLLGGGLLQGAGRQATGGGDGDLFHGGEIDLEARAIVAEGVADDDFASLVGQVVDLLEILGGELTGGHGLNLLAVRATRGGGVGPGCCTPLALPCKAVLALRAPLTPLPTLPPPQGLL